MGTKRSAIHILVLVIVSLASVHLAAAATPPRPHQLLKALVTDPVWPAEWAGIWNVSTTERDCTTHAIVDSYAEADTFCSGGIFDSGDPGLVCEGTIDATSVNVTCTGSASELGCTVTITSSVMGTRSGDTLSGTGHYEIVYSGTCGGLPDECGDEEFTGTRIDGEPASCGSVPVVPTRGGLIKAKYLSDE